jgi:hypothetical protein
VRFICTIERLADDRWQASHSSRDVGAAQARGASREEAIEKLKGEIRYRLELCPCTGETYQHIEVEIVERQ